MMQQRTTQRRTLFFLCGTAAVSLHIVLIVVLAATEQGIVLLGGSILSLIALAVLLSITIPFVRDQSNPQPTPAADADAPSPEEIKRALRNQHVTRLVLHTLRNQVTQLESFASLLLKGVITAEHFPAMQQTVVGLGLTVRTHHILTTPRSTSRDEVFRATELFDQVRASLDGFLTKESNLSILIANNQSDVVVSGNGSYLEHALLAAVLNSAETISVHCTYGGTIQLSAQIEGEQIALRVEDSGPGFTLPMLQRIQAPLLAGNTQELYGLSQYDGRPGLGLALICEVARVHDGIVTCGNGSVLGGAWVQISLPALPMPRKAI